MNVQKAIMIFFTIIMIKVCALYYIYGQKENPFVTQRKKVYSEPRKKSSLITKIHGLISGTMKNNSIKETIDHHLNNLQVLVEEPVIDDWHLLPDKFERINQNVIYKSFNIKKPLKREKVNMIFIVSSAPARIERRMAIRETWWTDCRSNKQLSIKCIFLTDMKDPKTSVGKDLIEEESKYKDLYFQNLQGGHDFGKRFLYHLVWSLQMYHYDYFVRMDDDYFLCMERFIKEVPMPPKTHYHWGWVHCVDNIVRPEESIILLSRDIVELFLGQNPNKMLCHRWADQMIGVWHAELKVQNLYNHDTILHHHPPAQFIAKFKTLQNVCTKYIGVHGAYPVQMRTLWKNRGPRVHTKGATLMSHSAPCTKRNFMNWQSFDPSWREVPKLCNSNPDWGGSHGSTYIGRQGA